VAVEVILLAADAPPAPDANAPRAQDPPATFEPEPEPKPPPAKEAEPEPSPPADSAPLAMPEAPSPKAPPRRAAKARTTVAPAAARRDRREEHAGAPAGGTSGPAPRVAATGPRYDAAYLSNPAPSYPPAARRRNLQGRVLVYAVVGPGGDCARAEVRRTSGHPILDEAALQAVRAWRFVPATRDGRPVAEGVEIPIVFRLEG
jgi:protein TonB